MKGDHHGWESQPTVKRASVSGLVKNHYDTLYNIALGGRAGTGGAPRPN